MMADAVARAAGVPGEIARPATMLSGDQTPTAETAPKGRHQLQRRLLRLVQLSTATTGRLDCCLCGRDGRAATRGAIHVVLAEGDWQLARSL